MIIKKEALNQVVNIAIVAIAFLIALNIYRSQSRKISEILQIIDILESNQTLTSKDIRIEHARWEIIDDVLSNHLFKSLGENPWYFRINEHYYEIISFIMVC